MVSAPVERTRVARAARPYHGTPVVPWEELRRDRELVDALRDAVTAGVTLADLALILRIEIGATYVGRERIRWFLGEYVSDPDRRPLYE